MIVHQRPVTVDAVPATVRENGWAVVRGLPFAPRGKPDAAGILAIARSWGRPSDRDAENAIWPIRPIGAGSQFTFSQRFGEAALHTDATYRTRPESFVCLFMVRPASDGGATRLLSARDALALAPAGDWLRDRLERTDWGWRTPAPFRGGSLRTAVAGLDRTLRWRADTLLPPVDGVQERAAREFSARIADAPQVTETHLEQGDALIIDNRKMLHGRTSFTDANRLAFRVRLWELR